MLAPDKVSGLGSDRKEADHPFTAVAFDRTLVRESGEIATRHLVGMRDRPTLAVDNGVERVERWAIGWASFRNCTNESFLHASEPNGSIALPTFRRSGRADPRTGTGARALAPPPMHEGSGIRPRRSGAPATAGVRCHPARDHGFGAGALGTP